MLIRPRPARPATSSALRTLSLLLSRRMKPLSRLVLTSAMSGAPSASIAQQRSAYSSSIRAARRAQRPPPGHNPPASIAEMRSGASFAKLGVRLDQRRRAGDQRPRSLPSRGVLAESSNLRIAAIRVSASLPTNACRTCQASVPARSLGVGRIIDRGVEVDHRLGRKDAQTGRDQRRVEPLLRGQQRCPGLERAELRRSGVDQPVRRHHAGRSRKAEAPRGQAVDRLPLDRRGAAGSAPRRRPSAASARSIRRYGRGAAHRRSGPRASPARRQARSTSPAPARGCSDRTFDPVLDRAERRRIGIGERACTATCDHLRREAVGVDARRPASARASASPMRSSSQARSAAQSTGLTSTAPAPSRAARRAARYAPSARRAAYPSAASGSKGMRGFGAPGGGAGEAKRVGLS